jgi:tetratricopeptide (TPR) repeat protein
VLLAVCLLAAPAAVAEPYIPVSDDQVLERLPESVDPALKDIKRLRKALAAQPDNLTLAAAVAMRAIEASREFGDPRFLGQAQAAISPWWKIPDPPAQVLLLRATIRQSNHAFDDAIADLNRLLARNPADGQALLTRATVLTVQAKYAEARSDCARLARLTLPIVVTTCMASPMSLSGDAEEAYRALTAALAQVPNADARVREWAQTLAGEIAERSGDHAAAEMHYRAALALDPRDPYLVAAYCDFLLERDRPREVIPFVRNQTKNDNLLLRLALAEAKLPDATDAFARHRRELADRFEAAHRRGDSLHKREEARFRLLIESDPRGALKLAREDWQVQREPADLHILFQAATACGDAATLREVGQWIAKHLLVDAALTINAGSRG